MTWRGETEVTGGGLMRLLMYGGAHDTVQNVVLFEPEEAIEAHRALERWLMADDHDQAERWELAVTRAADQLREAGMFDANWTENDRRELAEKILDRAAPRGVFAIAQQILADPWRYDHLVKFATGGWTIQHPVQERLDGTLFDCRFMAMEAEDQLISTEWSNDVNPAGLYRMWIAGPLDLGLELVEAHPEWEDPSDG